MSPKYDTTILPETRHFSKHITLWCFNIKSSLIVNTLLFSSQCCQTPIVKRPSNLYTFASINIFQIHFHHNTDFKENVFIFSAQSNILRRMCAFLLGHLHKYASTKPLHHFLVFSLHSTECAHSYKSTTHVKENVFIFSP